MQCPAPNPLVFESDRLDEHLSALRGDQPIALFGLKALNDILGGVHPGLNYAIGTGPGRGKTTLALQEADKLANDSHPVIYVSAELPAHKLLEKSLARLSGGKLALSEVADAAAADHPKHEAFEAALDMYRSCIAPNLCITGPLNTVELSNLVGLIARERNEAPIVFIDYLQLLACGITAGQLGNHSVRKGLARNIKPLRLASHRPELDHARVLQVWQVEQAQPRHVRRLFDGRVQLRLRSFSCRR